MAQENIITIQIAAGTDELIKAFGDADKASVKFSANIVKNIAPIKTASEEASSSIKDGFKDAFNSIGKGVAIGNIVSDTIKGAFSAVVDFAKGSVNAAAEQEAALNRLSQALRASGDFSVATVRDFEAFASALQSTSVYGDEVIIGQLAIAKSFGTTNEQAKQLVTAAANLAATFGGSLDENVQRLAKTLDGTAGKLNEQIPALRGLTAEQLRAGAAIEVVNSKFSGASQNEIESYAGKLTQTKNALSDFQEELGAFVTKSSVTSFFLRVTTGLFQELTQELVNSRVEQERANGTYVETESSLNSLAEKYASVKDEIEKYQAVITKDADKGLLDSLFSFDNAPLAKEKVQLLTAELAKLDAQIKKASEQVANQPAISNGTTGGKNNDTRTQSEKDEASKIIAEREALQSQLISMQAEYDAYEANLKLQKDTLTAEERATEYQNLLTFEQNKIEAIRAAELEKAKLIKDSGLQKATEDQINLKADLARQKTFIDNKTRFEKERTAMERQENQTRLQIASNFIQAGLALTKEGSLAQKALAITQATISTYQGAANALADTRPATLGPAVAASIIAVGLANVARISGAKFAEGGIVGGNSYTGDKVPALLNSREMVFNLDQQKELYNIAKGNGGGGQAMIDAIREIVSELKSTPIIIEANSREIGRLVRDEQRNGFEVFA